MNNNDGVVSEDINRVSPVVPTQGREIANIFSIGAGVGLLTALSYFALENYVFGPLLCEGTATACEDSSLYATIVSIVLGSVIGLVALVQARVYRPLLIVLAASVTMWGFGSLVNDLAWYWGLLLAVLFFGLVYSLYAWIARVRSFIVAAVVTIILVVAARLVVSL